MGGGNFLIHSVRDPLNPKQPASNGNLFHYGHFILDFALPFLKFFKDLDITTLTLPPHAHFGTMKAIFSQIYPGVKVVETPANGDGSTTPLTVKGYCRSNFHTDLCAETDAFHHYVVDCALTGVLESEPVYPEIILIQRGKARLYKGHSNGTSRRSIENHNQLVETLTREYGDKFKNLVLENIPFYQQVLYFYHARVVIGQYGSGLVNVLWMRPETTCIGLTTGNLDTRDPVFIKCCQARDVEYIPIHCGSKTGTSWRVPINKLLDALQTQPSV